MRSFIIDTVSQLLAAMPSRGVPLFEVTVDEARPSDHDRYFRATITVNSPMFAEMMNEETT